MGDAYVHKSYQDTETVPRRQKKILPNNIEQYAFTMSQRVPTRALTSHWNFNAP